MTNTNGAPRQVGVRPFDRDMVRDHLDRNGLKFFVDQDGDYRVDFSAFSDAGYEITIWLTAEGTNEDIFVIRALAPNVSVPKTIWLDVMQACNTWNMEKRYPKAFLFLPPDSDDLYGAIHLEGQPDPMQLAILLPSREKALQGLVSELLRDKQF